MKLVSMAEQLQPGNMSPSAMQSISCSGVPHAATGPQNSPDVCSRVRNHTFPLENVSHSELHKDTGWASLVWRNLTSLHRVLTQTPLVWSGTQTESQGFSCNISAADHWLARGWDHHRPTPWSNHKATALSGRLAVTCSIWRLAQSQWKITETKWSVKTVH